VAADSEATSNVRFELELVGGAFERRYRKLRPDVEEIAWGSLDTTGLDDAVRRDAQARWTLVAFNEYKTAASMAAVVRTLIEAQAPLDLVAYASTFVTDELVHAELAARMAMELGGAAEVLHDPHESFVDADRDRSPLLRGAEVVVRVSAVAEVLSSAIGRALWHATKEPLARSVLGRIMRDEFKHAALGAAFLDWADASLGAEDRRHLSSCAQSVVDTYRRVVGVPSERELPPHPANPLTWMSSSACRTVRDVAIRDQVIAPLARRGIVVS